MVGNTCPTPAQQDSTGKKEDCSKGGQMMRQSFFNKFFDDYFAEGSIYKSEYK